MEKARTASAKDGELGKGKAKAKDDKEKIESKSNSNKDKNCFCCDMIGHVKADCRRKKRDDEERRTTLAQNSQTSSAVTTTPPGLANVPMSTSGQRLVSLRELIVPSHVSDEEFHTPMRIFVLRAGFAH